MLELHILTRTAKKEKWKTAAKTTGTLKIERDSCLAGTNLSLGLRQIVKADLYI